MKKLIKIFVLVLLFFIATCCGAKKLTKYSSVEDLFDVYMDGFKNADPDRMISVYPDFAKDYFGKYVTKENIQKSLDNFGDNIEMSIEVTRKDKLSNDELESLNEEIKSTFTDYVLASECYLIKGNTHIKGSKTERDGTLDEMYYCNFNGTWRLIGD